jgi:hypothetical protein
MVHPSTLSSLSFSKWNMPIAPSNAPPHVGVADDEAEWLDVVDETNTVVGAEQRAICHLQGLRHRAVYVLLNNDHGEILIQVRRDDRRGETGGPEASRLTPETEPGDENGDGAGEGRREKGDENGDGAGEGRR